MKEVKWPDLYIKDFGVSQIENKTKLIIMQKKMKSFYVDFLLPLYKPIQNNKDFSFSVTAEELTCRIMYQDLKKFYGIKTIRDLFYKVSENRPELTKERIEKLIEYMKLMKESSND